MNVALAAAATLVATAFAIATFDRWQRRRRPHEGAWALSLVFFALGSFALWWAEARGWSLASFSLFFLAGAVLNVPWLALGTVYLLAGPRVGDRVRTWLIALSGAAVGVVFTAPASTSDLSGVELPKGSDLFGVAPRVFAAVGSGVAAIVIIGGAVWSIVRMLRGRQPATSGTHRQVIDVRRSASGNALIAIGTLVLSASGTFAGRLGADRAFAITLLAGIVVLFAGFLVASARPAGSQRTAQQLAGIVAR